MIRIRPFEAGDEVAFRELNEAWITALFELEQPDIEVLSDPSTHILKPGGKILMAVDGERAVGCVAMLPHGPGCFELGKMTVHESCRGMGVGRRLLEAAIAAGREAGASRLYLESNPKLTDAVHLYQSVGFRHLSAERVVKSPYARSGVYMEMWLQG